jgi:hypothetical protein
MLTVGASTRQIDFSDIVAFLTGRNPLCSWLLFTYKVDLGPQSFLFCASLLCQNSLIHCNWCYGHISRDGMLGTVPWNTALYKAPASCLLHFQEKESWFWCWSPKILCSIGNTSEVSKLWLPIILEESLNWKLCKDLTPSWDHPCRENTCLLHQDDKELLWVHKHQNFYTAFHDSLVNCFNP